MRQVVANGTVDARGVNISADLALRIVYAFGDADQQVWKSARFESATFESDIWFYGAEFERASFYKAVFKGEAMFDKASFLNDANFQGVQFLSDRDWVTFSDSRFCGEARFDGSVFNSQFHLGSSTVRGLAAFVNARFKDDAALENCHFLGGIDFGRAQFDRVVDLRRTKIRGHTEFALAVFEGQLQLADLHLDPGPLALSRVHFASGVQIDLNNVTLTLGGSDFSGPSLLRGVGEESRVASLEFADVGNLVLANVDLRTCRFYGAHNLDRLRLEDVGSLESPPKNLKQLGWPPYWKWTNRQVIAEEHLWRLQRDQRWRTTAQVDEGYRERMNGLDKSGSRVLDPREISGIYRSLRKGREDNRDASGASDYYYGEMEMRRQGARRAGDGAPGAEVAGRRAEWFVLTFYWLLSGYALRSSRAIVSLVLLVAVFSVLFGWFGIDHPAPGINTALTYSIQTSTNWFGTNFAPPVHLTGPGEAFEVVLRVLGPLLLALAVVSLRGRVTR